MLVVLQWIETHKMSYYRAADPMARVPKMTRGKFSLARRIHCCPNFLHFFPTSVSVLWRTCVYAHAYRRYMNYRYYQITVATNELPLLPNNTAVKHFCTIRSGVDWIFIVGAPVWRWPGQYGTLGRMFYSLLLKRKVVAATVTASCSVSHFLTWHLL
jgi:hypothetical protein